MDPLFSVISSGELLLACAVALGAGLIKGMVGFAMPMLMISGMSSVIDPKLALAGLILPTVATNGWQALRQGPRAALASISRFRLFLLVGLVALLASAQLVRVLSPGTMLLLIGVPVTGFALVMLVGLRFHVPAARRNLVEIVVGSVAGLTGGMSGVWGPPTVLYLTAIDTPKADQVRIQGVIYGLGALALMLAHFGSGVLRSDTVQFSAALLLPALIGTWLGFQIQDRIDQRLFRRITLFVLLVAALNLVRRGMLA